MPAERAAVAGPAQRGVPTFYIEVVDNLGVVDIYAKSGAEVGAQLAGPTSVRVGRHAPITLPIPVCPQKATTAALPPAAGGAGAGWVRIRAPIDRCAGRARLEEATRAIARIGRSVTAASIGELKDIRCQTCGASILSEDMQNADFPCNVRDLPSAHWSELVDCWMCHPEEDTLNVNPELMFAFEPDTESAAVRDGPDPTGGPGPSPSSGVHMWVGNTFGLVPIALTRGLSAKVVPLGDKERFHNAYSPLYCASCAGMVGEAGRVGRRRTAKLYLHRIGIRNTTATLTAGLSQVACSELLSHAGAHAIYKFVIEGRVSCQPAALVHLVGWNADILASPAPDSTADASATPVFERCAKVLFLGPGDKDFDAVSKQWLAGDAAELVAFLDEDCACLLELLAANSRRIPPQLRTMAGMTRSFLAL
ncbi:hypothetical protein IWQ57_003080 [Coemansia nantahalensis]|uniref:Uncharacterized protein n=1 Tax=Coemansia nantahalensis TaxID=2789366 RepID=A0ACC1JXN3_9FUNG|nr:hypothetical protein IWQ57_003080 [Coemansia nantahalensis]